ncbi:hypothetical protein FAE19_RS05295 [Enterococcus hirae]|uniref:hypothetical protein n=1 Tax=Enterococcus sp. C74 TaxID=3231332 RepID=UPI001A0D5254|nr:hypothetical protein [Enterococcus hirae]EMF0230585.1 hypothetical protein [Enterococcus hirae]EMF0271902.1 hypothetical protein [Enterococcus hirae]EMF0391805.1 hypothetical protein [Enterococcus hirae]EMF0442696.1 hypothetical protein [Enterococcus hirae]
MMIQLAGMQTGKIYFVGKNKCEAHKWLTETFTTNKKLRRHYPKQLLKDDQILPEPMLIVKRIGNNE